MSFGLPFRRSHKARILQFLGRNPYPGPVTDGVFYREKMRAIHRVAPDLGLERVLEVGGGRSGLTSLLYPEAEVVNLDVDPGHAGVPCNQKAGVRFVCGDATRLPFGTEAFDAVTMFDVLEHVPAHEEAVAEVHRVLRPGGFIIVSTPNDNWRFPYYPFMQRFCPTDEEIMDQWGHVRRGYAPSELEALFRKPPDRTSSFINPLTALSHDVAFSTFSRWQRVLLHFTISPLTLLGYFLHKDTTKGTETAAVWHKAL
jgi:SAM-dependent methyltransferase